MAEQPWNAAQAFTVNILRFKNFRERMKRAHDREVSTLRETVDSFRVQAEAHFDFLRRTPQSIATLYAAQSARSSAENALSWASICERTLAMLPGEEALGREMAFVYLMAILDGFIAGWRVDMGLDTGKGKAKTARPEVIRKTCRQLDIEYAFPADFDRTLKEMRARRHVLVHRAGIADAKYCKIAGAPELCDQRLEISEDYLDQADRFVTELVLDLIARSPRLQPGR
jgi:hypothetical protein